MNKVYYTSKMAADSALFSHIKLKLLQVGTGSISSDLPNP